MGDAFIHNEFVITDAERTQILFVDGSSVSVGPNPDLTIDEFVFDPETGRQDDAERPARRCAFLAASRRAGSLLLVHLGAATIGVAAEFSLQV